MLTCCIMLFTGLQGSIPRLFAHVCFNTIHPRCCAKGTHDLNDISIGCWPTMARPFAGEYSARNSNYSGREERGWCWTAQQSHAFLLHFWTSAKCLRRFLALTTASAGIRACEGTLFEAIRRPPSFGVTPIFTHDNSKSGPLRSEPRQLNE